MSALDALVERLPESEIAGLSWLLYAHCSDRSTPVLRACLRQMMAARAFYAGHVIRSGRLMLDAHRLDRRKNPLGCYALWIDHWLTNELGERHSGS